MNPSLLRQSFLALIALLVLAACKDDPPPPPKIVLFKSDNSIAVLDPGTRIQKPLFRIESTDTLVAAFRVDDSTLRFVTLKSDSIVSDTESIHLELFQLDLTSNSVHRNAKARIRLHRYDTVLVHADYLAHPGGRDSSLDFGIRIRETQAIAYIWNLPGFHPGTDDPIVEKGTNLFEIRGNDTVQITHDEHGYDPKCMNGYSRAKLHPDGDHVFANHRPSSSCLSPNSFGALNIFLRAVGEAPKLVSISKSTGRQKTVLNGDFGGGEFSEDGQFLLIARFFPSGDSLDHRFVYFDLDRKEPIPIDSANAAFWAQ